MLYNIHLRVEGCFLHFHVFGEDPLLAYIALFALKGTNWLLRAVFSYIHIRGVKKYLHSNGDLVIFIFLVFF